MAGLQKISFRRHVEAFNVLRGPIFMGLLLLSVVVPFLQQLSIWTLTRGCLLLFATALALHDASRWCIRRVRLSLQKSAQKIVLDDVLLAIFHPETGVISLLVGSFLGNAAMYSFLPTTPDQRVVLVQHALDGIVEAHHPPQEEALQRAHEILREPGGFLRLVPSSLQNWLRMDASSDVGDAIKTTDREEVTPPSPTATEFSSKRHQERSRISPDDPLLDGNSTASELSSVSQVHRNGDTPVRFSSIAPTPSVQFQHEDKSPSRKQPQSAVEDAPTLHPPPPLIRPPGQTQQHQFHEILESLFSDLTTSQLQRLCTSLPNDSTLQTISLAAAAALALQFRYSPSARRLVHTAWHACWTLGGSATLLASVLALVTRRSVLSTRPVQQQQQLGPNWAQSIGSSIRIWVQRYGLDRRKWQGLLAAFVLCYFGRRRRRRGYLSSQS